MTRCLLYVISNNVAMLTVISNNVAMLTVIGNNVAMLTVIGNNLAMRKPIVICNNFAMLISSSFVYHRIKSDS